MDGGLRPVKGEDVLHQQQVLAEAGDGEPFAGLQLRAFQHRPPGRQVQEGVIRLFVVPQGELIVGRLDSAIAGIAEGRRHGSIVPGLHQQAGSAELFWKVQGVSVRERVMLHPPGAGETGQLFGRRVRLREGVVQAAEALAPAVLEAVGRGRAAASRQAQQQGHCAERHDDAFP